MSQVMQVGTQWRLTTGQPVTTKPALPIGTYTMGLDPKCGEIYLTESPQFNNPVRLYCGLSDKAARIWTTFLARKSSTGVLLTGEKGSGKTLLAKRLSMMADNAGMSTIIVPHAFPGQILGAFMQNIGIPCVFIFDEFEKMWDKDDQPGLLTVLDGVFPARHLFVLTCNERGYVNPAFVNRPGRLFYNMEFKGLTSDQIIEYATEHLLNKAHMAQLSTLGDVMENLNFDQLQAVVEEMNRYVEDAYTALPWLNIKPYADRLSNYEIKAVSRAGVPAIGTYPIEWEGSPICSPHPIEVAITLPKSGPPTKSEEETVKFLGEGVLREDHTVFVTNEHLTNVDRRAGKFTFVVDGFTLTFTRKREQLAPFGQYAILAGSVKSGEAPVTQETSHATAPKLV